MMKTRTDMRNKILTSIQDSSQSNKDYVAYTSQLAKDFDLDLELIGEVNEFINNPKPVNILGTGLQPLRSIERANAISSAKNNLLHTLYEVTDDVKEIQYTIDIGPLHKRLGEGETTENIKLLTFSHTAGENYMQHVINNIHAHNRSEFTIPSLHVSETPMYHKPKKMLVLIQDPNQAHLDRLYHLNEILNVELVFVFEKKKMSRVIDFITNTSPEHKKYINHSNTFAFDKTSNQLDVIVKDSKPDWIATSYEDIPLLESILVSDRNKRFQLTNWPLVNF